MKASEEDLVPVTTRGGDDGKSGLIDGSRRFKDDLFFEALGFVDEAQVALGCCRAAIRDYHKNVASVTNVSRLLDQLEMVQYLLLTAGGVMACPGNSPPAAGQPVVTDEDVLKIERALTWWRNQVELEPRFFIAGDTTCGAEFDRARTMVRRAERAVVAVVRRQGIDEQKTVSRFLNRLSDWLFVLARWADKELSHE